MVRSESIHALITFFTVEFTKCHVPVLFSTAPTGRSNHWLQTVFFLDLHDSFYVKIGEEATGKLHKICHLDRYDRIDLTIKIECIGKCCCVKEEQNFKLK